MRIKCEYCGGYISDTDERCPFCQASNSHLKRVGNEVPQTIEELENWYFEHNLPPEDVTRFFIGKNIQEARAFGIYFDSNTGNYVVYKNKGNGERAIRYEGKDEAYAVSELYMKLKEEIVNQKSNNISSGNSIKHNKSGSSLFKTLLILIFFSNFVIPYAIILFLHINNLDSGYYLHDNNPYYLYSSCLKLSKKCEIYKYDIENNSWSLSYGKADFSKKEYVGSTWNNSNIEIGKNYTDEDWYLELHPPVLSYGYYNYNGNKYYHQYNDWFRYSNGNWIETSVPDTDILRNPDSYYDSYATSDDTYDFENYYHRYYGSSSSSSYDNNNSWSSSSDDSWDSSSSWDSNDSWDSGSTDWDSDW